MRHDHSKLTHNVGNQKSHDEVDGHASHGERNESSGHFQNRQLLVVLPIERDPEDSAKAYLFMSACSCLGKLYCLDLRCYTSKETQSHQLQYRKFAFLPYADFHQGRLFACSLKVSLPSPEHSYEYDSNDETGRYIR